jgi:hypothetical protein
LAGASGEDLFAEGCALKQAFLQGSATLSSQQGPGIRQSQER